MIKYMNHFEMLSTAFQCVARLMAYESFKQIYPSIFMLLLVYESQTVRSPTVNYNLLQHLEHPPVVTFGLTDLTLPNARSSRTATRNNGQIQTAHKK
jgi:hypothetical protein